MGKLRINMNRQLKFRAWDTKYGIMLDSDSSGISYIFALAKKDGLTIQQYTGLKDKNGVEIYEGDIVKATSDQYTNENFVGKVIFDEGCFLTWINKNDIRGLWGEDDIEVIGNIFENKDLLEKEQ